MRILFVQANRVWHHGGFPTSATTNCAEGSLRWPLFEAGFGKMHKFTSFFILYCSKSRSLFMDLICHYCTMLLFEAICSIWKHLPKRSYVTLIQDVKSDGDALHETVKDFRGQSVSLILTFIVHVKFAKYMSGPLRINQIVFFLHQLLMMQLPTDATAEDIERFFQGYNLAPYSTRFLRV